MRRHEITWAAPAPFWPEATGANAAVIDRPAILRFASDSFMEDFMGVLATDPPRLGEFRARPETWRGPTPAPGTPLPKPGRTFALPLQRRGFTKRRNGNPAPSDSPATASILKLYQPVQQRFYLVSACLVCQTPGLPDRRIDAGKQERAAFLVRRLLPPAGDPDGAFNPGTWEEHAFVALAPGKFAWKKVAPTGPDPDDPLAVIVDDEERLPLFASAYVEDDERSRRLLSGLIPVGRREAYMCAPKNSAETPTGVAGTTPVTVRKTLFRSLVAEPWKALIARAAAFTARSNAPKTKLENDNPADPNAVKATRVIEREQTQQASWLTLIDFANYLRDYLPDVLSAVQNNRATLSVSPTLSADRLAAAQALLTALRATGIGANLRSVIENYSSLTTVATSLADALRRIKPPNESEPTIEQKMDRTTTSFLHDRANSEWPGFLFPLADTEYPGECAVPATSAVSLDAMEQADLGENPATAVDRLVALVVRALPAESSAPEPAPSAASQPSADLRPGWFVIRCVYERPYCGPLHDDVVSVRTEPFQMAMFFDPDAPARPLRIGLPIDTTPAGLRKFDRNTAFVMSDVLCGQVKRLKGLTLADLVLSILPWPLHKDLSVPEGGPCKDASQNGIGTICAISIPIITICALILLMIMVTILDIIFRWLPYFILCFPVPKLAGKKPS